jgi:IclR family acetate operon transcriptional repressor
VQELIWLCRGRSRGNRDIGRELPLHSMALGKVLLASLDKAERDALRAQLDLRRWTKATIWSRSDLREHLDAINKLRLCIC